MTSKTTCFGGVGAAAEAQATTWRMVKAIANILIEKSFGNVDGGLLQRCMWVWVGIGQMGNRMTSGNPINADATADQKMPRAATRLASFVSSEICPDASKPT